MSEFPKMLYSDTEAGDGKLFNSELNYLVVQDKDAQEEALASGWRLTVQQEEEEPDLAEIKAKAKSRGIKLTGKSAETLLKEIAEHDSSN